MLTAGGTIGAIDRTLGGFGMALLWLAIVVVPGLLLAAGIIGALSDRHPTIGATLDALWRAVWISLACIGAAALVLEWQFRTTHPLPQVRFASPDSLTYLQRPDPVLGWRGAKDFSQRVAFITGTRVFKTNSLGFRDIEQTIDQRPHVVVLGDSFPNAWGLDVEDGIVHQIRTKLPGAQLFNASWHGYGKDQIAWSYRRLARPLQPRVVVMMFIIDPFKDTSRPIYAGIRKPYYLRAGDALELAGTPVLYHQGAAADRAYYGDWHRRPHRQPMGGGGLSRRRLPPGELGPRPPDVDRAVLARGSARGAAPGRCDRSQDPRQQSRRNHRRRRPPDRRAGPDTESLHLDEGPG